MRQPPADPEVLGLKALMDIQASRLAARIAPDGSAVPLDAQDRRRWDRPLISQGLDALARAESLAEAREHFVDAAGLTRNARERAHLLGRAAACDT